MLKFYLKKTMEMHFVKSEIAKEKIESNQLIDKLRSQT